MTDYLSYLVDQFPYLGLFVLIILGGIGMPFPEDTTLILGGFLISEEVVRPLSAILVIYSGLLIADFFIFLVGNKYGRAVINHPMFRKLISSNSISAIERRFAKRGVAMIIIGRHLIGLRAQIFLVAGVMKMPPLKFLAADAISAPLTMALMMGAGYAGGYSLEIVKRHVTKVEHIAVVLLTIALIVYVFYRYFKGRRI